jgi:hypothetical protein
VAQATVASLAGGEALLDPNSVAMFTEDKTFGRIFEEPGISVE